MGDTKSYNYRKLGKFLWSINVKRWEIQRALEEYQIKVDKERLSLIYMGWDEIEREHDDLQEEFCQMQFVEEAVLGITPRP